MVLVILASLWSACAPLPPADREEPGAESSHATLRLRSNPSGAQLTLDGTPTRFLTPCVVTPMPPGEHRVEVTLPGHRNWSRSVLMKAGETLSIDIHFVPTATGTLKISSVPFQSRVFIDGRPTQHVTPATISDLPVGTHTVNLEKDGYDHWSQAIVILKGRQLSLMASLKPSLELTGKLRIQSAPAKATILLDGYPTGNTTPATLFNLQAGRHQVLLSKKGHAEWEEEVTIREGETANLLVTLLREKARIWGSAEIKTIPSGATIFLDGILLRSTSPVEMEPLSLGTHSLRVEKDGFELWEGRFEVLPGEKAKVSVILLAIP